MKQDLKFLTNYISESVIDSKIRFIKNGFPFVLCSLIRNFVS